MSKDYTGLALVLIVTAVSYGCSAEKHDYDPSVQLLGSENADSVVEQAYHRLRSGGTESIPALVRNLKNTEQACTRFFQREALVEKLDGTYEIARPTIGDACEDILREMLDFECSNKLTQSYSIIQADTFENWWRSRSQESLESLRKECRKQMLTNIQSDIKVESSAERVALLTQQYNYLTECDSD